MSKEYKVGDKVKTTGGEIGTVVSVTKSGNEKYPFVYEVECDGVLHVTNRVQPLKRLKISDLINVYHNQ